jgi:hypothetical protein
MAQEETWVYYANNRTASARDGRGRPARFRRGWQKFLTALLRAMSAWVV